jgi:hypothetical protein
MNKSFENLKNVIKEKSQGKVFKTIYLWSVAILIILFLISLAIGISFGIGYFTGFILELILKIIGIQIAYNLKIIFGILGVAAFLIKGA